MPANLTPQYQKAEAAYRRAQTPQERVECLEQMLMLIPKHKGTEKLQADLKSRLKEAREEQRTEKKSGKSGRSYRIPRQGAGTVVIIGPPNSGKSRILAELTNASPEVADYPFTTHEPFPGMMPWEDVLVQLIDTPPVAAGHIESYITGYVRSADLVLLCLNGSSDDAPAETADVVEQLAARKTLLAAESGFDEDDYSSLRVQSLLVVTHAADPDADLRLELFRERCRLELPVLKLELGQADSVEALRTRIYDSLDVIRVYTKKPGRPADEQAPYTLPRGGAVEDLAALVHRDLAESLKYARIWGPSAHDGTTVGREHVLADRDVVELHV